MSDLTIAGRAALIAFVVALLALPWIASGYILSVSIICLYLAYMGQAWNLMLGFAGLLSIGHALFVGLGAYASGFLFTKWGVPPVIGVAAAVAIAMLMGAIIGYLGFRFAISGV
jgi:branched-chain amino acid transport system permease protein